MHKKKNSPIKNSIKYIPTILYNTTFSLTHHNIKSIKNIKPFYRFKQPNRKYYLKIMSTTYRFAIVNLSAT